LGDQGVRKITDYLVHVKFNVVNILDMFPDHVLVNQGNFMKRAASVDRRK